MSAKATEMYKYPNVLDAPYPAGNAVTTRMAAELVVQGMNAHEQISRPMLRGQSFKQEIDSGRPILLHAYHGAVTKLEHVVVVVGYGETADSRRIVVYDPYGAWQGTSGSYNTNGGGDSLSHRGRWASYDFGTVFGPSNHLIVARPAAPAALSAAAAITSAPDAISDEPDDGRGTGA